MTAVRQSAQTTENPIIRVRGLKNCFGEQVIHDGLDLDVCRGEDQDLRWRALSLIRGAGKAAHEHVAALREIFAREADEDLRRDAGEILAEIESAR